MIAFTTMCVLMSGAAAEVSLDVLPVPAVIASTLGAAPQGAPSRGKHIKGRGAPQAGGTPEPVSMLLVAGGVLGYGFVRLRRSAVGRSSKG